MAAIDWQWQTYTELSTSELYDILKLRQDVFILEQQCLYPDLDDQDQISLHLTGRVDGKLRAYVRVIPKQKNDQAIMVIGRVIVDSSLRGTGAGKAMMRETLDYIAKHHQSLTIELSAQQYLLKFYQSFGFVATSEPYDDDGIMHINMRLASP